MLIGHSSETRPARMTFLAVNIDSSERFEYKFHRIPDHGPG